LRVAARVRAVRFAVAAAGPSAVHVARYARAAAKSGARSGARRGPAGVQRAPAKGCGGPGRHRSRRRRRWSRSSA